MFTIGSYHIVGKRRSFTAVSLDGAALMMIMDYLSGQTADPSSGHFVEFLP